ncbi:unnamed protein product [Peronospora farinosa]|uniref:Uncharacterized protein n=1 Tax=Peronospora farinosa TaxID=134698 RepID=A0ABN8BV00_9STRA|nr:unnamed protein product [Peronospora farinosa]
MQLGSEIVYEDFQVAAPVHWMARVWKYWVFLSDKDVQSIVSEAQENDTDTKQEFQKRATTWQQRDKHLNDEDLNDEIEYIIRGRKRRRTESLLTTKINPEQLERSFDVLLLPDVMERVCSIMSGTRLCRMTLMGRVLQS